MQLGYHKVVTVLDGRQKHRVFLGLLLGIVRVTVGLCTLPVGEHELDEDVIAFDQIGVQPAVDAPLSRIVLVLTALDVGIDGGGLEVEQTPVEHHVELATHLPLGSIRQGDFLDGPTLDPHGDSIWIIFQIIIGGINHQIISDRIRVAQTLHDGGQGCRPPSLLDAVVDGMAETCGEEIRDIGFTVLRGHPLGQDDLFRAPEQRRGRDVVFLPDVVVLIME